MAETKETTAVEQLFAGQPRLFGGLSNERELVAMLPPEFPARFVRPFTNPWIEAASRIFFAGAKTSEWKWRSEDADVRQHQIECFAGALKGFDLKHEEKEALCGWMLSEMLTEVPAK